MSGADRGVGTQECEQRRSALRIAVVSPDRDAFSETFIRAHVEHLPGEVVHLHGALPPLWKDGGEPLPPHALHLAGRIAGLSVRREPDTVTRFLAGHLPAAPRERALARYLAGRNMDVVLAEYGYTGVAMAPVTRRAGIPLVVHFHGWDAYHEGVLAQHRDAYAQLFRQAAAVVAVSSDMVDQLASLGADPDRLHLNPCGVDPDAFSPDGPRSDRPIFLAVGRFVEKKAPHLTILAFKQVADALPDARLLMVGDGPLLGACRILVQALDLEGRVIFRGSLPHAKVAEAMRAATCFVQHSVRTPEGDSEGNPVAVLEAAASGLPVVATRHAGIAESVVDGETGFLVAEGDVDGMAEGMRRLASDPELARRMGEAGRARVQAQYSLDGSIRGLAGILAQAVEEAGLKSQRRLTQR